MRRAGEVPILENTAHAEVRRRTVTAVTACKICFLRASQITGIARIYPELAMRLRRCGARSGKTKGKRYREAMEHAQEGGLTIKPPRISVFKQDVTQGQGVKPKGRQRQVTRSSTVSDMSLRTQALTAEAEPTTSSSIETGEFVEAAAAAAVDSGSTRDDTARGLAALSRKVDAMADQQAQIVAALARIEQREQTPKAAGTGGDSRFRLP